MKRILLLMISLTLLLAFRVRAQKKSIWSNGGLTMQYAGSIGFLSLGYLQRITNDKLELAALYGRTPKRYGGPLSSFTIKALYSPWLIRVGERALVEPIQPGVFVCQHFGNNLEFLWPGDQYPPNYYWWPRSLRSHVSLSTAVSVGFESKWLERACVYLEANSNDLYIASYTIEKNHRSLSLYDIIYFGSGLKVYVK